MQYAKGEADLVYISFNSMIVRLKDRTGSAAPPDSERFQFYDSPIKSIY